MLIKDVLLSCKRGHSDPSLTIGVLVLSDKLNESPLPGRHWAVGLQ